MLNFDRSTVKHGTQHIQNNCHFLTALECTKFVRPGEAYSAPQTLYLL